MDKARSGDGWLTADHLAAAAVGDDGACRWGLLTLDPQTSAVSEARRWARQMLESWAAEDLEWTLSQLLTEVVTNAVLHAGTRLRVRLELDKESGRLRCEVTDGSPARPRVRRHGAQATTGRGLQLVETLSAGWGAVPTDRGKTVWFDVHDGSSAGDGDEFLDALADLGVVAGPASARPSDPDVVARTLTQQARGRPSRRPRCLGSGVAA